MKNESSKEQVNKQSTKFIFLIPVVLLIIAPLIKFPYGFYVFLRLVITFTSGLIIYHSYKNTNEVNLTVVIFSLILILFNPFVPIYLSREIWLPIDFIAASIYAYSFYKLQKR